MKVGGTVSISLTLKPALQDMFMSALKSQQVVQLDNC